MRRIGFFTGARPKAIRKYKPRTVAFRRALERKVTNFACAARCLAPAPCSLPCDPPVGGQTPSVCHLESCRSRFGNPYRVSHSTDWYKLLIKREILAFANHLREMYDTPYIEI